MFLIGKMCKKPVESKYFSNHVITEHMINGNDDGLPKEEIMYAVISTTSTVDEVCKKMSQDMYREQAICYSGEKCAVFV